MRFLSERDKGYRIGNSGSRSTVNKVDDTQVIQQKNLNGFSKEVLDKVETFSNYGFTAVVKPPTGEGSKQQTAEAITMHLGSNRSHAVVVAHGDRRYRLYKLADGEVAMHDDQGHQVHFRRDGIWASAPNSKKVVVQIMQDDALPQDGNTVNGQTLGQVQQAGRTAISTLQIDKDNFSVTVPGTITMNCANYHVNASAGINEIAGADLNLKGGKVFTVGETHLGVDSLSEQAIPLVADVDGSPAKQTRVKIA